MTSVLPKSWLAPRTNEATRPPESSKPATLPVPSYDDPAKVSPNSAWLGAERAVTAALSTPHDAVLAELQGRTPKVGSSQLSGPAVMSSASPERAQDAGASPTQTSPLTEASPEPVYDPFSGGLAYVLPPRTPPDGDAGEFGQSTDELWAQLSRIRELQSEIAGMHVQMEGMGAADGRVLRKAHARTPTDNVHSGEWPDPAEEEEDRKRERDTQFANLTQAFEGRHASIDNIMNKLDDLSKALTSFHALPTPTMEFTSRHNTKDSMTTVFSSPSPTFTADPGSPGLPFSPQVAPSRLHAALNKLQIPRTQSPDPHASPIS